MIGLLYSVAWLKLEPRAAGLSREDVRFPLDSVDC